MNSHIPAADDAAADNTFLKQFLTKIPEPVRQSFSREQLDALYSALTSHPMVKVVL